MKSSAARDALVSRILVTGAGGFLGSHVTHHLAAAGHEVIALGRSASMRQALTDPKISAVICDLSDRAAVSALALENVESIVHCAGLSSNWGPRRDFERHNVIATDNLLEQAGRWGVRHLVHVSSSSVYFRFRDQLDVRETNVLPRPVNDYAWSKVAAERLVRAKEGFATTIVRPRGIYGKGDRALLPRLLRAAARGPVPCFRGGRAVIDLTHVDDVVAAIATILADKDKAAGAVYNVSGGEAISIHDIVVRSAGLAGVTVRWRKMPWPVTIAAIRAMETFQRRFRPDIEPVVTAYSAGLLAFSQTLDLSAVRADLGWRPKISFDEGLRRTFEAP